MAKVFACDIQSSSLVKLLYSCCLYWFKYNFLSAQRLVVTFCVDAAQNMLIEDRNTQNS